ncbi:ArsR family transcriptional regulator [Alkalibacterium kapii]
MRRIIFTPKYELCIYEIEATLNMIQSNVSRHLTKLRNEDIVIS